MIGGGCKPGDQAMIVQDAFHGAAVGRMVSVVRPLPEKAQHPLQPGILKTWDCDTGGERRLCPSCGLLVTRPCIPDAWLMPIRPEPEEQQVEQAELQPLTTRELATLQGDEVPA